MDSLWITADIMELDRTPLERQLFARICYRAGIATDGICRDTNPDLAKAIKIHQQSASDGVRNLAKAGLLTSTVDGKNRAIAPLRKFLIPYLERADRYKKNADAKKQGKEIPYTPHPKEIPYPDYPKEIPYANEGQGISLGYIRDFLRVHKEFPYSLYIDTKPLKPLQNFLSLFRAGKIAFVPFAFPQNGLQSNLETEPKEIPYVEPQPPDKPLDADEKERVGFVTSLQTDRRLLYALSSVQQVKGEQAQQLIEDYVTTQWAAQNLKGRQPKDLLSHCQSWIKSQITITQDREQRNKQRALPATSNAGRPTPNSTHGDRYGNADYETAFGLVDALASAGGLNRQSD